MIIDITGLKTQLARGSQFVFLGPDLAAELEMTEEQVFASPMSQSKKRNVITSLYYTISQLILFIPNYFLAIVKLQQLLLLLQ